MAPCDLNAGHRTAESGVHPAGLQALTQPFFASFLLLPLECDLLKIY